MLSDYALQITQGQDEINYSGLFSVVAGNGTSSSTNAPGNSTASITATSNLSAGTGTALPRNTTFRYEQLRVIPPISILMLGPS